MSRKYNAYDNRHLAVGGVGFGIGCAATAAAVLYIGGAFGGGDDNEGAENTAEETAVTTTESSTTAAPSSSAFPSDDASEGAEDGAEGEDGFSGVRGEEEPNDSEGVFGLPVNIQDSEKSQGLVGVLNHLSVPDDWDYPETLDEYKEFSPKGTSATGMSARFATDKKVDTTELEKFVDSNVNDGKGPNKPGDKIEKDEGKKSFDKVFRIHTNSDPEHPVVFAHVEYGGKAYILKSFAASENNKSFVKVVVFSIDDYGVDSQGHVTLKNTTGNYLFN